ncbi:MULTISPECIES: GPR1/FUN34/YaaH family transporter [unclassified Pseudonocardia]|uniref:GPR1/FUN34/YaaH family transporter n=1 Tax=unclassified Pseudonocardia TaxID=2619320 RepID=UPI00095A13FC|nr:MULTISPECIES: GPR1/FUN34/YaaH family transporter [unclassified Pseudonocardia]MBN9098603.1 hypothetical protein [Pseudonocardia sp.]OJY52065.1 MAG: hypothetical protein BGP03_08480 [Pseudonocardia sp. 73-21]
MTAVDTGDPGRRASAAHSLDVEEPLTPEVVPSPLSGDPLLLALPTFAVGAIGLGLYLWGYIPSGGMLAILGIVAGLGVGAGSVWAAALGQSAVAGILGVFSGFYVSFTVLVLGLTHGWWGINAADPANATIVVHTQATFLIAFLVLFVAITLTTLRLFMAFTVLMVLVDITVVLVLLGVLNGSTGLLQAGAIGVWAFVAVGLYIWAAQMSVGTGGKPMALGKPIIT